ncbi:hypothetical protein [Nocardia arthritidis]|uniref:hypothetical protein n=1 Tax=Nocardia arthritidis TaxID=228602 RepID=UPI00142D8929|nr:hypothetical protein [Nocardia arthritidis]
MSKQYTDGELADFTQRWVAIWNEADPALRHKRVREVWAADGVQVLVDPPVEMREQAASLAIPAPPLTVHGQEAMERRVTRAYEMFIAPGEYVFEPEEPATNLPAGLIGLHWKMVTRADGAKAGGGYDVFGLDAQGRVLTCHQFIEGVR